MNKKEINWNDLKSLCMEWSPVIFLGIWIVMMHCVAHLGTGDDIWFYNVAHGDDFALLKWLQERYFQWSSRSLIEGSLIISIILPKVLWRITNAMIMIITIVFLSKIFVTKKNRIQGNCILVACFMIISYKAISSAGWQATTINYVWPLMALVISVYPLYKMVNRCSFMWYEFIIYMLASLYASSSEQACILLLFSYLGVGIYLYKERLFHILWLIQIIIGGFGLLNILLCPGNANRNVQETKQWFPEYTDFSVLQKIDIGISSTIRSLFLERNHMFILLVIIIAALGWNRHRNWIKRILTTLPMLVVGGLNVLVFFVGGQNILYSFVSENGVLFSMEQNSFKVFVWYGFLIIICAVILIDLFMLTNNLRQRLLVGMIYLLGLMTKAMLGFSATVWASYSRTGWYCQIAFICLILILLEAWNYRDKKVTGLLLSGFTLLAMLGAVYNYMTVFSVSL